MADIHIEKNHSLDFDTARAQAKKWLEEANREFGLNVDYQENDDGDTAAIKKAGVDGRAILTKDKVVFEADLAFLAKPLKTSIINSIQAGLDKFFA